MSINTRLRGGISWSALELVGRQGLKFLVTAILARMLSPDEFGAVASVTLVPLVIASLSTGVLTSYLVRHPNATSSTEYTCFTMAAAMSLALTSLSIIFAKTLGDVLGVRDQWYILPALTVCSLANAAAMVPQARLLRRLEIRPIAIRTLVATVGAGVLALSLAYYGFGVWALVAQIVSHEVIATVTVLSLVKWRPRIFIRRRELSSALEFCIPLTAVSLMSAVTSKLYAPFAANGIGLTELGYFQRAEATANLPAVFVGGVLNRFVLPYLGRANREGNLAQEVLYLTSLVTFSLTSAMSLLASVSLDFLVVVYGVEWTQSARPLQIICVGMALVPIQALLGEAVTTAGKVGALLRYDVARKAFVAGLMIFGLSAGISGIAAGFSIGQCVSLLILTVFASRHLNITVRSYLSTIAVNCVPALVTFVCSVGTRMNHWGDQSNFVSLILSSTVLVGTLGVTTFIVRPTGSVALYRLLQPPSRSGEARS